MPRNMMISKFFLRYLILLFKELLIESTLILQVPARLLLVMWERMDIILIDEYMLELANLYLSNN